MTGETQLLPRRLWLDFSQFFFKQYWSYGADVNMSTAQLGLGNSLASLLVALMAPILGAIADKGSAKKKFLVFFAYLGVLMTASLFLVHKGAWAWAIFIYMMGLIGFSGANVFYDALLPGITSEKNIDYVSGFGFAMGYLGGGLLFLINVLMTLMPQTFGLPDAAMAVRISFLSVAAWWGFFTLFTILWVPEGQQASETVGRANPITEGFIQFFSTLKKIRHLKTILVFLLAYWFYIDGVDTIIRMAVDYGMSIGFEPNDLIKALLITQFVGFPSALVFGKLGQKWSVRKSIYLALAIYICITIWGTMMTQKYEFYVLAVVIGLVQGGIQALSRSYYSRIIPQDKSAEFFGFYNMLGKFAAILGPLLIGVVGLLVRRIIMPVSPTPDELEQVGIMAARIGIGSILLLFITGAILFYFVDEEKGKAELEILSEE